MDDLQSFLDHALKEIKLTNNDDVETKIDYDIGREIAELVVFYRSEVDMTQEQLSQKSGVSQANISKIENNNYCPSIAVLKRLADAMGKRLKIDFIDNEELF